jgi:hypothetical protein
MSAWTAADVLHLLAAKPGGSALLPGVRSQADRDVLAEMQRRGWLMVADFGVISATITEHGREVLAVGRRAA